MSLISPAPTPSPDHLKKQQAAGSASAQSVSNSAPTGAFLTNLVGAPAAPVQAEQSPLSFTAGNLSSTLKALNSSGPAQRASQALPPQQQPQPQQLASVTQKPSAIASIQLDNTLPIVVCESRARIPLTTGGEIFLHVYRNNVDTKEHIAFVFGDRIRSKSLFAARPGETEEDRMVRGAYDGTLFPGRQASKIADTNSKTCPHHNSNTTTRHKDTLVRIHSECYTGETAWSARCDCGEQLDEAARVMAQEGEGVIVYLRQEGRGIGLAEKLKAYNLQDLGADTVTANLMLRHPADARSFGLATAILLDLGLHDVRLMTNNPDKIRAVEGKNHEIHVTERVPMVPLSWQNKGGFQSKEVDQYLKTKIERMGHMIHE